MPSPDQITPVFFPVSGADLPPSSSPAAPQPPLHSQIRCRRQPPPSDQRGTSSSSSDRSEERCLLPLAATSCRHCRRLLPEIANNHPIQSRVWRTFLIVLVAYTASVSLFEFGFLPKPTLPFSIVDYTVDGFFGVDIVLMFFVAYRWRITYSLVDNHANITRKYLYICFVMDVVSIIPSEFFLKILPKIVQPYSFLLRLWRLRSVNSYFSRLEKDIHFNYFLVRCIKLICVTFFIVHCEGCFYYFFAAMHSDPTKTWIGATMPNFRTSSLWIQYVTSMYWSTTTFTTVGYGDMHAQSTIEMIFGILFMLLNMGLAIYILGNMAELVVHGTSRTRKFRDMIQAASEFAQRNQLPMHLKEQMLAHHCLKYNADSEGLQQQETLDSLPKSIQSSISHHLFYDLVQTVYLFQGISNESLFQLVSEMKAEYFPLREDVILQNEMPTDFYILVTGSVELIDSRNGVEPVAQQSESGYLFGEIGVVCYRPHLFTVRTNKLCRLLRLNRTSFLNIIQSNVNDGSIIMNNLLQHLEVQDRPIMEGVLRDINNTLTRGNIDFPLPLRFAVMRDDGSLLCQLLKRDLNPNESDINGHTTLHLAASKGSEICVFLLLDYGADPNSRDSVGSVPLWEALLGKHEPVIEMLLDDGACLSYGDMAQYACTAAEKNSLDLLKDIVTYGGDVTLAKADGSTALHHALGWKNIEMVGFLLDNGDDIGKVGGDFLSQLKSDDPQFYQEIFSRIASKVAQISRVPPNNGHEKWNSSTHPKFVRGLHRFLQWRRGYSDRAPPRIKISCPEIPYSTSKIMTVGKSIEELLFIGGKKFSFKPTKIFLKNDEIDDITDIRDGDHLFLFSDFGMGQKESSSSL